VSQKASALSQLVNGLINHSLDPDTRGRRLVYELTAKACDDIIAELDDLDVLEGLVHPTTRESMKRSRKTGYRPRTPTTTASTAPEEKP
jgi:hypothetical protein